MEVEEAAVPDPTLDAPLGVQGARVKLVTAVFDDEDGVKFEFQ
jgi:hypothetical protein